MLERLPPRLRAWGQTSNAQLLLVVAFLLAFANRSFLAQVLHAYALTAASAPALLSLLLVVGAVTTAMLGLVCFGRATRPLLVVVLLLAAVVAHFMDRYGVVVNADMLRNALETDAAEAFDLLSWRLLSDLLLLGVLPAGVLCRIPLAWRGWRGELLARLKLLGFCAVLVVAAVPAFGAFYASFVREHKVLRSYVNPAYALTSVLRLVGEATGRRDSAALKPVGTDARIPAHDRHRELIVLVLGETARADRFALNGYARDTNPLMRQAGAVSFPDFWACDTATATALPCMFAPSAGGDSKRQENLLDVLQHAGVNVLWLDNNSDSKGVAARVPYRSFKSRATNSICDEECRDVGMLAGLQAYIDAHPSGDIFVVLHQMGNHGPAYYKRYPPAFEKFVPACHSNDLSQCRQAEIDNAYDNALLYTDYFLSQVVGMLEQNSQAFEAALFYVSDHGESLGEGGIYLHGLPKALAPAAQLHVPALMWFARSYDEIDLPALVAVRTRRLSHEHLFHTVLGFMEIETAAYRAELDILNCCRKPGK